MCFRCGHPVHLEKCWRCRWAIADWVQDHPSDTGKGRDDTNEKGKDDTNEKGKDDTNTKEKSKDDTNEEGAGGNEGGSD